MNISIGIAAYNAEKNIKQILSSLLRQKGDGYVIKEIVVHSDCSTDSTVAVSESIGSKLVSVIDGRQRKGFAGSIISLLNILSGDVLILLNDDITIEDGMFVSKLAKAFIAEQNVGMACAVVQALPPTSFVDKAIQSTQSAYNKMRSAINNGNNIFTVDGKVMVISNDFKKKLTFPDNLKLAGNVDAYIYLLCIKNGFKYRYAQDAVVYFRNPGTVHDYIKWTSRNDSTPDMMKKLFGDLANREYNLPKTSFLYYSFIEFLKNPIGCLFIVATRFYIQRKATKLSSNFNSTWETVQSSKNLAE